MSVRQIAIAVVASAGVMLSANAAQAITMQECEANFKAAQTSGAIKTMKWADYRRIECGLSAPQAAAAADKPAAAKPKSKPAVKKEAPSTTAFSSPWGAPLPGSAKPGY